ncbi:large ribosomal subunit protein eL22-like [Mustela lutreola]|uniref:large ribosomal subunit protein eL22-like n=1 Tax=Mustela lutreola TaxID=9666 RepID=UPI0027978536|nr:large ribosomal subunit protein eL22-like [Mustela lutreola]
MVPVKKLVAKGGQKNPEQVLKFTLDRPRSVEDGITDAANVEPFLQERIPAHGKPGNLGGRVVTTERNKSRIAVTSELLFSPKRSLKPLTKHYLKESPRDWLCTAANCKENQDWCYFQINQDEEGEEMRIHTHLSGIFCMSS